jgi:acyl carrier protein
MKTLVKQFVVTNFAPDLGVEQLADDYDLLSGGVIDSLSLLSVISWLQERFEIDIEQVELAPDFFRSVNDIVAFIDRHSPPAASVPPGPMEVVSDGVE